MSQGSSVPQTKFKSRKEFMEWLGEMMVAPVEERTEEFEGEVRGRPRELKTYVMESNDGLEKIMAANTVKPSLQPTNLPEVSILRLEYENRSATFYLDTTDARFLLLYTNDLAVTTDRLYDRLVSSTSNRFDRVWLPTEVLGVISHLSGNLFRGFGLKFDDLFAVGRPEDQPIHELKMSVAGLSSADALDALKTKEGLRRTLSYSKVTVRRGDRAGFVTDEVGYRGRLITKSGDSIDDHVSLVEVVRKVYRGLIEEIERSSIGTRTVEERTLIEGQAFDLVLDRKIEELDTFVDRLLDSTAPFRLWGLKNKVFKNMRQVVAVDLHTGDSLDLEVTSSSVRVYLPKGACGNTILRMYVNLQHSFDSAIRLNEEKLQVRV